jgi:hypothetical protein
MTHMNHNKLLIKYLFYYYLLCIQKDIYILKFFKKKNKIKFQKIKFENLKLKS